MEGKYTEWPKGASTRSYRRLFYLVLLYVYDLLSLVHVQKYVCVYEYDVLQPCWIFVRRTRVRRTNVRACCIQMSFKSNVFLQDIHCKLFYIYYFLTLNMRRKQNYEVWKIAGRWQHDKMHRWLK